MGLARLVHPFPSILNAVVTMAIAFAAGGGVGTVARLGLAMLTIQFGIGATNDLADAERDAIAKPAKPIPAGLLDRATARSVAAGAFLLGLGSAATAGPGVLGLALLGTGAGLAYDLRLKGTPISWLPYAVGVPLLPLFAWLGGSGSLPGPILLAAGLAVPAGAGLALANELPDLERDAASGLQSVTTLLGRGAAWALGAALEIGVAIGAALSYQALGGRSDVWPVIALSIAVLGVGVGLGSAPAIGRRQRAWELQAIALGLLAGGWLAGVPRG